MPRRLLRTVPFLLASVLVACSGANDTAASVGDSTIGVPELATASGVFSSVAGLSTAPCGTESGEGDTAEAACNRYSLGALISFEIANGYAADHGIEVSDADVKSTATTFSKNFGDGALEAELESNDVTYDQFIEVLRASMVQQAVATDLAEGSATEAELRQEYEDQLADHTIVQVDHILVDTKAEAEDVYAQVTAPGATRQDFLDLAKQVSKDPSVTQNGGALGSTTVSQFTPAFADAVLKMDEGDISKPVKTEFGWHVIHMEKKEVTPFSQVRNDLLASKAGPAFADYERSVIADGSIDVNPRFGRLDPQTLTVVRITSTDPIGTATPPTGPVNTGPPQG